MLWQVSGLKGFNVQGTDGHCGKVKDFLVDDTDWHVRWIVGDIGSWLDPHKILLPPSAFSPPQESAHACPVALTKDSIMHSPDISVDPPVALQMKQDSFAALGVNTIAMMGPEAGVYPLAPIALPIDPSVAPKRGDSHLRSIEEVTGYDILASDGKMGQVQDFVMDDEGWRVSHLVVRWSTWWNQHLVIIPVSSVRDVDWDARAVRLNATTRGVKASPAYARMELCGRDTHRIDGRKA